MRLLSVVFLGLGLLFAQGCNTPGCLIQDQGVKLATNFVASTLQCSNVDVIKADLTKVVSNFGLCKAEKPPTGVLADTLCPVLTDAVVDFIAVNGIPSSWGCSATDAKALAKDKLTALCKQIPLETH